MRIEKRLALTVARKLVREKFVEDWKPANLASYFEAEIRRCLEREKKAKVKK